MANEIGDLLNEVGRILAIDKQYPLDGTFLYAEAAWQMVSVAVFKDLGDRILYEDPTDALSDTVLELWYAEAPDKRWSTMQYRIEGGKFEASFTYEPLDPEVSTLDRREHILQQRYGNKRIVYPPLP